MSVAYFLAGVSVTSLRFSLVHRVGPEDMRVLGDSEFSRVRHSLCDLNQSPGGLSQGLLGVGGLEPGAYREPLLSPTSTSPRIQLLFSSPDCGGESVCVCWGPHGCPLPISLHLSSPPLRAPGTTRWRRRGHRDGKGRVSSPLAECTGALHTARRPDAGELAEKSC